MEVACPHEWVHVPLLDLECGLLGLALATHAEPALWRRTPLHDDSYHRHGHSFTVFLTSSIVCAVARLYMAIYTIETDINGSSMQSTVCGISLLYMTYIPLPPFLHLQHSGILKVVHRNSTWHNFVAAGAFMVLHIYLFYNTFHRISWHLTMIYIFAWHHACSYRDGSVFHDSWWSPKEYNCIIIFFTITKIFSL
jgi:hypothetical protein